MPTHRRSQSSVKSVFLPVRPTFTIAASVGLSTTTATDPVHTLFGVQFDVSQKFYLVQRQAGTFSRLRRVRVCRGASRAGGFRAETVPLPPGGRPPPSRTGGTRGLPKFVNLYRISDNDRFLITYFGEKHQLFRRYEPRIAVASCPTHRGSRG